MSDGNYGWIGQPTPPPVKPPKKTYGWRNAMYAIMAVIVIGGIAITCSNPEATKQGYSDKVGTAAPTTTQAPVTIPPTTQAPVVAPPAPVVPPAPVAPPVATEPAGITNGIYETGTEVALGTYKSAGPTPGLIKLCYFHLKDGDNYVDQGVVNEGQARVKITRKGLEFKSSGCEPWVKVG